MSSLGNPIGIRLSYSMLFPKGDYYQTDPTLWLKSLFEPTPHVPKDNSGIRYDGSVAYHFTVDTLPAFLREAGSALRTNAE